MHMPIHPITQFAGILLLGGGLLSAQRSVPVRHTLRVENEQRVYYLHVPASVTGAKSVPLVVMLHGRGSDGRAAASPYYGWVALADQQGFIVAFPDAVGRPRSWRPAWGGRKSPDSAFLCALLDELQKRCRVDPARVFLTGHSSGGIMSLSFAATHGERVAAIGPVAGTIGAGLLRIPRPRTPVSVILVHGMADRIVPYDAERGKRAAYPMLTGAPDSAAFWALHNGCGKQPVRTELADGRVHLDVWSGGKAGTRVELYSIERGQHGWPAARSALPATARIWAFFTAHARRLATEPPAKPTGRPTSRPTGRV